MVSITVSADKPKEAAEVIQAINNIYADKVAEILVNSSMKLDAERVTKAVAGKASMKEY